MKPKLLSQRQIDICNKTISSNTFYLLVCDALLQKKALSVVRMADGERMFHNYCNDISDLLVDDAWIERMGVLGISKDELSFRLNQAATKCTYFAPSVSGLYREDYEIYSLFPKRDCYVDNFFVNNWTEEMKIDLFKTAQHVLFIHRNTSTADAMQNRAKSISVKVSYLKLTNWQEAEGVIEKAKSIDAPLVLFSAGPASKYIGPEIATSGKISKVTLDIGHAADSWTLLSLKDVKRNN